YIGRVSRPARRQRGQRIVAPTTRSSRSSVSSSSRLPTQAGRPGWKDWLAAVSWTVTMVCMDAPLPYPGRRRASRTARSACAMITLLLVGAPWASPRTGETPRGEQVVSRWERGTPRSGGDETGWSRDDRQPGGVAGAKARLEGQSSGEPHRRRQPTSSSHPHRESAADGASNDPALAEPPPKLPPGSSELPSGSTGLAPGTGRGGAGGLRGGAGAAESGRATARGEPASLSAWSGGPAIGGLAITAGKTGAAGSEAQCGRLGGASARLADGATAFGGRGSEWGIRMPNPESRTAWRGRGPGAGWCQAAARGARAGRCARGAGACCRSLRSWL